MSQEIRRRRTEDPEVDAMVVLGQALDGLDLDTRQRVLDWARARYLDAEKRIIGTQLMEEMRVYVEVVKREAERLGVDDRSFIHAVSAVRAKRELAPVDTGEVSDEEVRAEITT